MGSRSNTAPLELGLRSLNTHARDRRRSDVALVIGAQRFQACPFGLTESAVVVKAKPESATVVYIVDDDVAVRDGFDRLLRSAGLEPRAYACAEKFMEEVCNQPRACVLLDITMPRFSGPQVQTMLKERGITLPVITVSARDDDDTRAHARNLGARMFLRKPVDDQALLDAISWVTGPAR